MERYCYEIFLGSPELDSVAWCNFLLAVAKFHKTKSWHVVISLKFGIIYYYLLSDLLLPPSLGVEHFLIKITEDQKFEVLSATKIYFNTWSDNFVKLQTKLSFKDYHLNRIQFDFWPGFGKLLGCATFQTQKASTSSITCSRFALFTPAQLLSINFSINRQFSYRKIPRYLNASKVVPFTKGDEKSSILALETFPVSTKSTYLRPDDYDFAKHSLILGSSGAGKSRFIASIVDKIFQSIPEKYQVVVIDPHDALKYDLGGISSQTVIDFRSAARSIDLFCNHTENVGVSVELLLDLFKTLLAKEYNSRLERVIRYSAHLLLVAGNFSFCSLRKLLVDAEFRLSLLEKLDDKLPINVSRFFLADFNELKTQNYNVAFAPLISFIDEMLMVPVFASDCQPRTLDELLSDNFLSVFSLSRLYLGNRVTCTIAGLLFQQLFLFCEKRHDERQLVIIIDEVAVVEHPILARFLSELRKFRVTVILAGQYFEQITPSLRAAILANATNFYIFRVSKADASILVKSLDIKPTGADSDDDPEKILTGLKTRECIIQISHQEKIYPAFKAKTTDFMPPPYREISLEIEDLAKNTKVNTRDTVLAFDDSLDIDELMLSNSTGRQALSNDRTTQDLEFPLL